MRKSLLLIIALASSLSVGQAFASQKANQEKAAERTENGKTVREGFINVTGGKVWYRMVGSGNRTPLIVLHGGPGFPSNYLKPLEALADERPVIFYDQLGCGKSERPTDKSLWRVERFVEELAQVRKALGLERVHILGHSWGTMLATDYMLTRPKGVVGLVLASPGISIKRFQDDAKKLLATLPKDVQDTINKHERAGTTHSEEYQAASMVFLQQYVCRMNPFPKEVMDSLSGMGQEVYETMWGPSEFSVTGNLKNYERADRVKEIRVPTLFTCGRYDEVTPEATRWYQSLIPKSKLVVFEKSAHMTMLEERDHYVATVRAFLKEAERR